MLAAHKSRTSQLNAERLKEDGKKETFEFLIPEIPPLKNEKNVIPTGKQIPRTPLKCEIIITKPSPESSDEPKFCIDENEETLFKNMIPKGREIPRTPPNYSNVPFLISGCHVKPSSFLQPIDLGVKPLEDEDDVDNVAIKEDFITVRKHAWPKGYNLDLVLSEMIEEVNLGDGEKGLLAVGNQKEKGQQESTKLCIPAVNATQNSELLKEKTEQRVSILNLDMTENSLKGNEKHHGCIETGKSIIKDVTKPDEGLVAQKKRGRVREAPNKSSMVSKQEKENKVAVEVKKQGRCKSKSSAGVAENNIKDSIEHKRHMGVGDSILRDSNKQDEEIKVEKKRGRPRQVPKVSLSSTKQDCRDGKKQENGNKIAVKVQKQARCRNKSNAGVVENSIKDSVEHQEHVDVGDSNLRDSDKKDGEIKVEKKRGRPRQVSKTSLSSTKQDCKDRSIKLKGDGNEENLLLTKQKVEKSDESSGKGRRRCSKREECSLSSDLQTRRNPRRQAKEGIHYRLSED